MTRALRWHLPLMLFSLLMAALTAVSLVGLVVDDRILVGSPIWFKPFKFAVSLGLYAVTLAWMLTLVTRFRRVGWWAGTVIALASAAEMAIIVGQVLRGARSHFNVGTPFDELLWDIMTYSILTLWIMHAVIAVTLLFTRFRDRATGLSIRLGLLLALVGLGLGTLMTGRADDEDVAAGIVGAHSVGVRDGGPYMPLTGWSTEGGDLRVPHFVGIHALQVIPLAVALFGRRATPKLAWGLTVGYAGLMALVTWQALRGQPLLRPDLLTALGALAVATWTAAVIARTLRTTDTTDDQKEVVHA
ncbi:hypothetical protein [Saccharothrix luteola]|uniref:hypothetical protein n=1 Tax=Saccharothrix luteola TaxID=2893018 RepID=UPI001E2EE0EE|nr:hypothetical protein [Saccharothrix luteola]MCC8249680.1 hypothetical protein [Saccharothrix luteola]